MFDKLIAQAVDLPHAIAIAADILGSCYVIAHIFSAIFGGRRP